MIVVQQALLQRASQEKQIPKERNEKTRRKSYFLICPKTPSALRSISYLLYISHRHRNSCFVHMMLIASVGEILTLMSWFFGSQSTRKWPILGCILGYNIRMVRRLNQRLH